MTSRVPGPIISTTDLILSPRGFGAEDGGRLGAAMRRQSLVRSTLVLPEVNYHLPQRFYKIATLFRSNSPRSLQLSLAACFAPNRIGQIEEK
jgi:hypothetical protein